MQLRFTQVQSAHRLIWVGDPESEWPEPVLRPVIDPHPPFGFYIVAATHTGFVGVAVRVSDEEPAYDPSAWTDTEIVTMDLASTEFDVIPPMGGGDVIENSLPHPGRYAVRVSGRNRVEPEEPLEIAAEQYLIDVWPADPA